MKARGQILTTLIVSLLALYSTSLCQAQSDTAWVRRYAGAGVDVGRAIQVDAAGNVFVTGTSAGTGTDYDYVTVKYDPDGDTVWVRRFNGPSSGKDEALALQVDDVSNVYVTGYSTAAGTGRDFATIKYDVDGDTLWVRRYNGPANLDDNPNALEIDLLGNIYVTGSSYGVGTERDYATVKYDTDGDTVWVRRHAGTGIDVARALKVDAAGNVYVTGTGTGSGTDYDFVTLKYNVDGDTVWVRSYNGPANGKDEALALNVDTDGNVYVTGYSYGVGTDRDYATVKYNTDGDTVWVRRYEPAGLDFPRALEVDSDGNVYVTGSSTGIAYDYATVKYNSDGDTAWVRRFDGPASGNDEALALRVVAGGGVVVTGYTSDASTGRDYRTIKYSADGDVVWTAQDDGQANLDDNANALQVDAYGNVYVTGDSYGVGTDRDYMTIKYGLCGCPSQSDFDEDEFLTPLDLSELIDVLFAGHVDVKDLSCPSPRADFDCDGFSTSLDLGGLIDHLFAGGSGPCNPCGN